MSCTKSEPVPTRFYAPLGMFSEEDMVGCEYLGDRIYWGGYYFQVTSGPLCRLYWGNGCAEPDCIESAWKPKDPVAFNNDPVNYRQGWNKDRCNYVSYLLGNGTYCTPQWGQDR